MLTFATIGVALAGYAATALLHVWGFEYAYGFVRLFSLDTEGNVPTYFSSLLHLISALLLSMCALLASRENSRQALYWWGLALFLLFMSIDEAVSIHELFMTPVRNLLDTGGIFFFAWVVPAFLILVVLAILYWPFIMSMPRSLMVRFLVAIGVFLSGAMGLEMIGGLIAENQGTDHASFYLITDLEETLELTGAVLFIRAILLHLAGIGRPVVVSVK